ncbi:MAG TPA: 30S ribosomal protein S4 [Actinomycetes bacterium]|jgi:small subunit ribosomal protein S4|nr:30S ribosomal protein S4 [Actinomycetes bacterium]
MSRTRSKVHLSRALGIPLTPKAVRHLERRPYPPGEHGRRRRTTSNYKAHLLEKQRLRAQYDLSEAQLRLALARAVRGGEKTGEALLVDLETRLDALVLRAGFARTIYQARQAVTHGHVTVNTRRVDRPSFRVRPGDVIEIAAGSKTKTPFLIAAAGEHAATVPPYLDVEIEALKARLVRLPVRAEIPVVCDERLVVEFYSR